LGLEAKERESVTYESPQVVTRVPVEGLLCDYVPREYYDECVGGGHGSEE
jgi:hypothetical protein